MNVDPVLADALRDIHRPVHVATGRLALALPGENGTARGAFVPALRLEDFGDAGFRADHRLRFAYVTGAMANGIGSADIVEEMGRAGMLGFFGAAGLSLQRVEAAIDGIARNLGD